MARDSESRTLPRRAGAGGPQRILLTVPALDMSGVSFSARCLCAGLLEQGAQVMVLARRGGEREWMFREMPLQVLVSSHFGLPLLGRGALATVREFSPHFVFAQDIEVFPPTRRLARDVGVPMAVIVNRLDEEDYSALARDGEVGVIAVSEAILERLGNRAGLARERIRVIPNGLDLGEFPAPDLDQPREHQVPVVGAYGRLAPHKGQRGFLEAAAKILASGRDAEFLLMGDGPDRAALRALANTLGIQSRVTFAPPTATDSRNLVNIDVFVEPSHREGLGLSVLQAMAMGVPVVASGVGGIFSLIKDGETGMLIPRGDSERLAGAVCELLDDPPKRQELARNARERIEADFDASRIARRFLDFAAERLSHRATPHA